MIKCKDCQWSDYPKRQETPETSEYLACGYIGGYRPKDKAYIFPDNSVFWVTPGFGCALGEAKFIGIEANL